MYEYDKIQAGAAYRIPAIGHGAIEFVEKRRKL